MDGTQITRIEGIAADIVVNPVYPENPGNLRSIHSLYTFAHHEP